MQSNKKVEEPFIARLDINKRAIPNITSSTIAMRNAGLLQSRSQFFSALSDQSGNGRDLLPEDDKDIRRILGPNVSSAFKPTYSYEDLVRFHECWREDGIASMCAELLAQSILGEHFKLVIDVNEEFEDDEERKAALDELKANEKLRSFKRELDIINKDIKATDTFKALLIQSIVFGSGAAIIERDPNTSLPISLKILPSMSLGRRFADKRNWKLIGLEYLDYQFPQSILKTEDLVYMAMRNYHMSPGTYHYGYSLFEKIVSLSETNRVINQRNLPETNFRLWSPMLLLKMPNNVNQSVMNKLRDDIANGAGNAIVTNQQVQVEPVLINVSLQEMTNERSSNNTEIIREMQFPELLYNVDIMNRATSQELMETWNVFVLGPYQHWLGDIIQEQWIDPIIKRLIENDTKGIIDEPGEATQQRQREGIIPPEEQQQQQGLPTTARAVSKTSIYENMRDPYTGEIRVSRLKWKIRVVFEPINLDTFLDKVKAYMILFNNGAGPIGGERVLRGVGLEEDIPLFQQKEEEKAMWQQQQFNMQQRPPTDSQGLGNPEDSKQPKPSGLMNQPGTGFETDMSKVMKDMLRVTPNSAAMKLKHKQQKEKDQRTLMEILLPEIRKKLAEI